MILAGSWYGESSSVGSAGVPCSELKRRLRCARFPTAAEQPTTHPAGLPATLIGTVVSSLRTSPSSPTTSDVTPANLPISRQHAPSRRTIEESSSGSTKPCRFRLRNNMETDKKTLILPVLLITVGVGWLLTTLGIAPGIDWVWTLGIAIVGFLAFVVGGFDKVTFVTGTFFIITSCLSVLRQTERITIDVEVPILVIVAGLLLLIARHPAIPLPKWVLRS